MNNEQFRVRADKVIHSLEAALLCTSATWQSPVMWAHYGHKHQGVCLGFDVTDGAEIHEVKYEPNRLIGLTDVLSPGKPMLEDQLIALLTTKFKEWEYEREWRMFASLDDRAAFLAPGTRCPGR